MKKIAPFFIILILLVKAGSSYGEGGEIRWDDLVSAIIQVESGGDTNAMGKGGDLWKITAYCSCEKCCGRWSDGKFASGRKCYSGGVACNWLPFGSRLQIGNNTQIFTVEDKGAKSLFGTKDNPIKAIDIWFPTHKQAKEFGVKYAEVEIKM